VTSNKNYEQPEMSKEVTVTSLVLSPPVGGRRAVVKTSLKTLLNTQIKDLCG